MADTREKTALVPIANGSEDMETAIIVDVLRRGGVEVTVASVETELLCTMARKMKFVADCHIDECADKEYDLIALPGGMPGAKHLHDSQVLIALLKKQQAAKKLYAAICAAPAVVLKPHGLLSGVAATAHPAFVDQLMVLVSKGDSRQGRVVVDANVVTSRGPGTAMEFALCLLEKLFSTEFALEVQEPMVPPLPWPEEVLPPLNAHEWPGLVTKRDPPSNE
eukprot:CAMPEP_0196579484 /NCGR_PEP_ID=MMETSP1081-20130531/22029_1 /TAXON_ID=36882 /ORGANISM="Pyramimonas amylifera, Strain CCMP720" /LENGTH=221 /DNA_ID=CAMNT_0041899095 /DNA_START=86 /DNA_END=751 /DNA_ORIENTATION=-